MARSHLVGLVIAVCFIPSAATTASFDPAGQAPATLSADPFSAPFWISASAATGVDGEVNYDRFTAAFRDAIRSQSLPRRRSAKSTSAEQPCQQTTVAHLEQTPKAMSTWRDALANADSVLEGTVTAVTPGFFQVSPATMLTVHVDRTLAGNSTISGPLDLFIPYFAADFIIGNSRFCNAGLPRNGGRFLPAVGDDILIFAFDAPRGNYLSASDQNLFFGRNDRVYAPLLFMTDPTLPKTMSFSALARAAT